MRLFLLEQLASLLFVLHPVLLTALERAIAHDIAVVADELRVVLAALVANLEVHEHIFTCYLFIRYVASSILSVRVGAKLQ